jgi:hypothetical protein
MNGLRRLGSLVGGWAGPGAPPRVRDAARAVHVASGADAADDAAGAALQTAWPRAVGEDVARRSRPMKFRRGVLTVMTASSTWSDQLTHLAPRILESLRQAVPQAKVRRLRFVVATGRSKVLLEGARTRDAETQAAGNPSSASHAASHEIAPPGLAAQQGQTQSPEAAGAIPDANARHPSPQATQAPETAAAGPDPNPHPRLQATEAPEAAAAGAHPNPHHPHPQAADVDPLQIVAHLRALQAQLDAERDRAGWAICVSCGRRFAPVSRRNVRCAPCAAARSARGLARIERLLVETPWLDEMGVLSRVPHATSRAYERARQRLLARWQQEIAAATRRLRRGMPTAADRVIAWSYVMLATGLPERALGRAVVIEVLGSQWAAALFDTPAGGVQEARVAPREKR